MQKKNKIIIIKYIKTVFLFSLKQFINQIFRNSRNLRNENYKNLAIINQYYTGRVRFQISFNSVR